MASALVVIVSVAVGVLVFRLTAGGEETSQAPGRAHSPSDAGDDGTVGTPGDAVGAGRSLEKGPREAFQGSIPVVADTPSWHARLGGAMGLVIAVAIGAIALALSLWAVGSFVARLLSDVGGAATTPAA